MRNRLFLLTFVLVVSSCNFNKQPGPYKGYNLKEGVVYYKYADLGIKKEKIQPGQVMEVLMNYALMDGTVFWNSADLWYPFAIYLSYDSLKNQNSYGKILLKSNVGDSINFILKPDLLFSSGKIGSFHRYLTTDSVVKVNVRIKAILDSTQLRLKLDRYAPLAKDREMKEQIELTHYIAVNKIPDSDKKGPIFLIPMVQGTGPEVTPGSRVSISYRGYFMNHKTFDSIPVNDPVDFNIGDSGQVITGLEIGIKKMREGEVAKIIIPSHSAFGEKGSSTGIVPPYTTLVYEVTMLKVKPTLKK